VSVNVALAEAFRYNRWANLKLLDACELLSDGQLDQAVPGTYGTIRRTLLHIVGGQQTDVLRTMGRQHEGELTGSSAWPGFALLRDVASSSSDDLLRIAEGLDQDRQVTLPYMGKRLQFPTSFFLAYALTHGVEHRTQIVITIAQMGLTVPDLDGWPYAGTMGYGLEV
jgi:uncharacterized damage-inducible protein DinB